jgi:hypothetical protein
MIPLLIITPIIAALLGYFLGYHTAKSLWQRTADLYRLRNERLLSGLRGVLCGLPGFTLRGVLDRYYADIRDEKELP